MIAFAALLALLVYLPIGFAAVIEERRESYEYIRRPSYTDVFARHRIR